MLGLLQNAVEMSHANTCPTAPRGQPATTLLCVSGLLLHAAVIVLVQTFCILEFDCKYIQGQHAVSLSGLLARLLLFTGRMQIVPFRHLLSEWVFTLRALPNSVEICAG